MASVKENATEVVEGVTKRAAVGPDDPDPFEGVVEVFPQRRLRDRLVLQAATTPEQERHGRVVEPFVLVLGDDERHAPFVVAGPADDRGEHAGELG